MGIPNQELLAHKPLNRSAAIYERALRVLPGGCSRNAILRQPHPLYASHASGCMITDIDGVERIDFANNMTAMIHGHADPRIGEAVSKQVEKGTAFNIGTEVEIDFAEHMVSRSSSFEKIRFVNSGTEAVMACLKAARAFTGRPKIAKAEGAYHGLYDYAEISQTAQPSNWGEIDRPNPVPVCHGTPPKALEDVVVIPFNDVERSIAILNEQAEDLACVLIDLMPHRAGLIPATGEYVTALRNWTSRNASLLVYDEVITYRSSYGGAQEWYHVDPDLTAMGKMIGGGFPIGAIAGRANVMDVMDPFAKKVLFPHSGTFSANPVSMVAGLTAMQVFDADAVEALNALGEYTRDTLRAVISDVDVPASVTGRGSMFKIHLKPQPPASYREAYAQPSETKLLSEFLNLLFDDGIILINSGAGTLSTPMTRDVVDRLVLTVRSALLSMRSQLEEQT
ncbi:aspartate aminotransferase family protein [Parasphingopyxis algicola]|uniref:aspartate aminotransferase family protein n=1 Tax=Parasphingopyxis algicola TaxID=2026624 RepID=UPI0015A29D96|nr:aspartate aminotransferase family protein [Parasphingopyxis algicola]QLC24931.1 aspartate aminotransferase family protein [Parasphingopyxis algicola]